MAQAYLDPYDFLGGGVGPQPAQDDAGIGSVPNLQDPYLFLGVGPGVVTQPTQGVSQGQPVDWDYTRQVGSGLALGFGPELQGFENYLRAGPSGRLGLDQHIVNAQGAQDSFERSNPIGASIAEIGGSIPTVVAANALTPGLSALTRSTSLLPRVAGGMLAGAEDSVLQTRITGGDIGSNALMGATIGGALPGASGVVKRLVTPKVEPQVVDLVRQMEDLGVKLRPSQVAMSSALRRADEFFASGGNEAQVRDFTKAVGKTFGTDAETLTPQVLEDAHKRITTQMDTLVKQTEIAYDADLGKALGIVGGSLKGLPRPVQQQVREAISAVKGTFGKGGKLAGEGYQNLTQRGGVLMNMAKDTNPAVRRAGGMLREALDDAMSRSAAPGTREAWDEARSQYKNLITVQPLLEGSPSGLVDPRMLKARVKAMFDDFGWGSQSDIQTLATGGQLMPKIDATGATKAGAHLPWYLRPGIVGGAGFGAAEYWLYMQHPAYAAALAAGAGGLGIAKAGVGAAMKGSAYRNALTGRQSVPGWMSSGRLPALTGAVNSLNSLGEDE